MIQTNSGIKLRGVVIRVAKTCLLASLSLVLLTGCEKDTTGMSGKELFEYYCAGCHQDGGQGNFLRGIPPNRGTSLSLGAIKHKIRNGLGGDTKMPKFPDMPEEQVTAIAAYVKTLKVPQ